jgi:hypothetical protein
MILNLNALTERDRLIEVGIAKAQTLEKSAKILK